MTCVSITFFLFLTYNNRKLITTTHSHHCHSISHVRLWGMGYHLSFPSFHQSFPTLPGLQAWNAPFPITVISFPMNLWGMHNYQSFPSLGLKEWNEPLPISHSISRAFLWGMCYYHPFSSLHQSFPLLFGLQGWNVPDSPSLPLPPLSVPSYRSSVRTKVQRVHRGVGPLPALQDNGAASHKATQLSTPLYCLTMTYE